MLFGVTFLVDSAAMAVTLWMSFYLLGRGFPSRITLRAVWVLWILSIFFFDADFNLFHATAGTAAVRSALIVIGLGAWYSLTLRLMSEETRRRMRMPAIGLYLLCAAASVSLLVERFQLFLDESENTLYVAHMSMGLSYVLYGAFLLLISCGILYNMLAGDRIGLTSQGRYFLLASVFPVLAVVYGVLGFASRPALPRFGLDLLILSAVTLLGISVARHQTLVERRTTLQDFPLTGLTVLAIAGLYALLAFRFGLPLEWSPEVLILAILTHSLYDLVREFLDRSRARTESSFRRQLRQLESVSTNEEALRERLQQGLDLLCEALKSSGGFIAVRRGADFSVVAERASLPAGSLFPAASAECEDVARPEGHELPGIAWIAPAFQLEEQVAVVALRAPRAKPEYSVEDRDLLGEVADRIGTIVSLNRLQSQRSDATVPGAGPADLPAADLHSGADELIAAITRPPDPEFVQMLEEALRHLADYLTLGRLPLADWAAVTGESHVERGKKLHTLLVESIASLRPSGERPPEPLPREWYSYAVLYDAYVEGVLNREIMARLYISEGTFNRTRRNAIRGLARMLQETRQKP